MPSDLPDFYESNLALLAKNHPHIWKLLTDSSPEPEGEIVDIPEQRVENREPDDGYDQIRSVGVACMPLLVWSDSIR